MYVHVRLKQKDNREKNVVVTTRLSITAAVSLRVLHRKDLDNNNSRSPTQGRCHGYTYRPPHQHHTLHPNLREK